jgi:AcrR family transcriptional regulator
LAETNARNALMVKSILDTATKLFDQRGYTETRMQDIASAMGVTRPSLYYYFNSEEEILVALLIDLISVDRVLMGVDDPSLPALDRLRDLMRRIGRQVVDQPARLRIVNRHFAQVPEKFRKDFTRQRRRVRSALTATIGAAVAEGVLRRGRSVQRAGAAQPRELLLGDAEQADQDVVIGRADGRRDIAGVRHVRADPPRRLDRGRELAELLMVQVIDDAAAAQRLGRGELAGLDDGRGCDAVSLQDGGGVVGRAANRPGRDQFRDVRAGGPSSRRRRESPVTKPGDLVHRIAEAAPLLVGADRDRHPAVQPGTAEDVVRFEAGVLVTAGPGICPVSCCSAIATPVMHTAASVWERSIRPPAPLRWRSSRPANTDSIAK